MKRSGLSDSTLLALREALPNLLEHWSPHSYSSDWVCCFCDQAHIEHDPECLGLKIQNDLIEEDE